MTQKLTTTEAENLAYLAGDTKTADLYARIDALQRALGQAVATLDEIVKMPARYRAGAASETLATIDEITHGDY